MRIPRKLIADTKKLVRSYKSKKLIHYRDFYEEIDIDNFHIGTKVDFKKIVKKNKFFFFIKKDVNKVWEKILSENEVVFSYKSKSGSEYLVNNKNEIFRLADHWGAIAGCEWTLDGKGELRTNVFITGPMTIGLATLSDFISFKRRISPKKDYVVNPEWKEQLKNIKRVADQLQRLKDRKEEFKVLSNEDKNFIGVNCGNFRYEIRNVKKTRRFRV